MSKETIYIGLIAVAIALVSILVAVIIRKRSWRKRKGREGEKIVARELSRLKRKDTVVLNDVLLPVSGGATSQIDHVVITTRGIFLIETKSHSGAIFGHEHSQYWVQYLGSQKRQVYNPLLQNKSHLRALQRILPDLDSSLFISMVVFTEATKLSVTAEDIIVPRRILPDRRIRRTFLPSERRKRHWWCPWREVRLDENNIVMPFDGMVEEIGRRRRVIERDELQCIADAILQRALRGESAARAHTAYAKATAKRANRDIRQGNCPRCGGVLVIMEGDRGEFLSCTNYPECRFTCRLDN